MWYIGFEINNIMIIIDPTLIGRKYYTSDPKSTYVLVAAYIKPDSGLIIVGKMDDANKHGESRLVTHKCTDIHILP